MLYFFQSYFSWSFFLATTLLLTLLYLLLYVLKNRLQNISLGAATQKKLNNILRRVLLWCEPLYLLSIFSFFLLVNPFWHGLLILFFTLTGFPLIRNYLIGLFLQYDSGFQKGKAIKVGSIRGDIQKVNGLGVYIMTSEGVQYMNYTRIQKQGFSLIANNSSKVYCYLNLSLKSDKCTPNMNIDFLLSKLFQIPYLDTTFKPILLEEKKDNTIKIKLLLRAGSHRKEIIDLVDSWGCQCTLSI